MSDAARAQHGKLVVICTMSCKEALIELVPVFEREKACAVDITYGSGPELAKKIEPAPAKPKEEEEKEEKKSRKQEDYQVIGQCIGQWNKMKDAALDGDINEALSYYSDYLDTRDQYRDSFNQLGVPRLRSVFASFGELYDCEVVFASAHCKSMVRNAAGTVTITKIRFERNPDRVWRIRSF